MMKTQLVAAPDSDTFLISREKYQDLTDTISLFKQELAKLTNIESLIIEKDGIISRLRSQLISCRKQLLSHKKVCPSLKIKPSSGNGLLVPSHAEPSTLESEDTPVYLTLKDTLPNLLDENEPFVAHSLFERVLVENRRVRLQNEIIQKAKSKCEEENETLKKRLLQLQKELDVSKVETEQVQMNLDAAERQHRETVWKMTERFSQMQQRAISDRQHVMPLSCAPRPMGMPSRLPTQLVVADGPSSSEPSSLPVHSPSARPISQHQQHWPSASTQTSPQLQEQASSWVFECPRCLRDLGNKAKYDEHTRKCMDE